MRTSRAGKEHITLFEDERLQAYLCPAGVWTIGVGHTSAAGPPAVHAGMTITANESAAILSRDLAAFELGVERLVKVPLTQNQFDVLVSFSMNCGLDALKRSTLLKKLNAGQYDAVPAELMKWTRAGGKELPGLVRRRRAEAKMWRGLDAMPVSDGEARLTPDKPKPSKKITQSKEANAAVAAGGLGTVAAASEVVDLVRNGGDALSSLNPTLIVLLVIVGIAAAIWYWRKKRLDEEGA